MICFREFQLKNAGKIVMIPLSFYMVCYIANMLCNCCKKDVENLSEFFHKLLDFTKQIPNLTHSNVSAH